MSDRLSGKTCVVTGGGTGIGLGIAEAFAREGCRVLIAGRRTEALEAAKRQIKADHPVIWRQVDVSDPASVDTLFAWAREEFERIDILVNAAGINVRRRSMAELDPADLQQMMQINAVGAFYCMRAVLPEMRTRGDGLIVNISSVAGLRGSVLGGVGYSMSKFALTALGQTVAREEGAHGIRVTNIYPGEVDTPMLNERPVPVSAERRAQIMQPVDVADAVLMVACLPPRAHVPDLVIKPTTHDF